MFFRFKQNKNAVNIASVKTRFKSRTLLKPNFLIMAHTQKKNITQCGTQRWIHCSFISLFLKFIVKLATTESFFIFDNELYKHTDGVAMGSRAHLGSTLASTFLRHYEKMGLRSALLDLNLFFTDAMLATFLFY